ncbi:bonus isoform c-related [Anaeramoeba ignava]|uniref:Bonus isoform c-related n=1 Tax=Anaeramoeba ignava TaxID=1746090 RepID=A0A9Q0RFQ7_ANAIG|nr:bonus isoform c-related [Anaeramoeba ignava]
MKSNQLIELLYCSNCQKKFENDCYSLPTCSHSLCHKCLAKSLESKPEFQKTNETDEFITLLTCPVCSYKYQLEDEISEEIPMNKQINFLAKVEASPKKNEVMNCQECEKEKAVFFCENCHVFFCQNCCKTIHSFKAFENHQISPYKGDEHIVVHHALECSEHPNKVKEYYCKECQESVCIDCVIIGKHKNHMITKLESLSIGSDLRVSLALKRNQSLIQILDKKTNEIAALLDVVNGVIPVAKNKIDENFKKAFDLFQKRKESLLIQVDQISHYVTNQIRKIKTKYDKRIAELKLCEYYSNNLLENPTDSTILYEMEGMLNKLQDVEELTDESYVADDFAMAVDFDNLPTFFDSLGYVDAPLMNLKGGPGNIQITSNQEMSGEIKCSTFVVKSGAVLTVKPWDGKSGGVLKILARSKIIIEKGGKIDLSGKGYRGGPAVFQATNGKAKQGESYEGQGSDLQEANKGGGGAGLGTGQFGGYGGGGGGYGTPGDDAEPNRYSGQFHPGAKGGESYGDERITELYMGSGGGSGHPYSNGQTKGKGGNGGGALLLQSRRIVNDGEIISNGEDGEDGVPSTYGSGGGGGSGGSILFICNLLINNGTVSALGGKKGIAHPSYSQGINSSGGKGGDGRIAVKGRAKGNTTSPTWFIYKK